VAQEVASRTSSALDNALLHRATKSSLDARQEILGVVAHDLRNPLSAIVMSVDALAGSQLLAATEGRTIVIMKRALGRMERMLNDLLDFSSIEAGRLSVHLGEQRLDDIVAHAIQEVGPLAITRAQIIEKRLPHGGTSVWCDADRIQQVLVNLLGNAIKFTPRHGRIAVGVTSGPSPNTIAVEVTDTGPGMTPEQTSHVFERRWQAQGTAHLGSGLGLYIAKGICTAHGGTISVESTPGEGSTFRFMLRTMPLPANEAS
jgi:signal transduction histidine kinase